MGDGLAADGTPGDDATSDGAAMRDGTVTEGAMDSGAADVFEEAPAHCSGDFQCIPAVPGGWAGPTDLYLGAAPAPTCPGLTTDSFDGMEGLQATAASCDCACGPTKITCGSASLTTSIVAGCATVCATTTPVLGACFAAPSGCLAVGATGTFQTLAVAVTGGSCAPVSTAEITPPPGRITLAPALRSGRRRPTVPPGRSARGRRAHRSSPPRASCRRAIRCVRRKDTPRRTPSSRG